jgi:hypothetical protein
MRSFRSMGLYIVIRAAGLYRVRASFLVSTRFRDLVQRSFLGSQIFWNSLCGRRCISAVTPLEQGFREIPLGPMGSDLEASVFWRKRRSLLFFQSLLGIKDDPSLDHAVDVACVGDIHQGVSLEQQQIRELALLDGPEFGLPAHDASTPLGSSG